MYVYGLLTFSASIGLRGLGEDILLKSQLGSMSWPVIGVVLDSHTLPFRVKKKNVLHQRT